MPCHVAPFAWAHTWGTRTAPTVSSRVRVCMRRSPRPEVGRVSGWGGGLRRREIWRPKSWQTLKSEGFSGTLHLEAYACIIRGLPGGTFPDPFVAGAWGGFKRATWAYPSRQEDKVPAKSRKQQRYLYAKFGAAWVKRHHFNRLAKKGRKK